KIEGSWPGCGQKVYVRVRAKHAIRPSTWSETYVTTSIAIPEPPNNVEATPKSSSEIELKWGGANESYSRESGFIIQYSTSSSFSSPVQTTADQNANGKTIGGLNANTTYYFRVKTQNCAGESGWSNTDNARTQEATTQAPSAPSELVLTPLLANNMNNVRLSWRDNSNNETGFEVESSTNGTTFSRATTTAANVTQYEINLTTSTKNYFRVRAITGAQQSGYSNVVDYDMGPESPLDLRATVISSSQINLAWSDRSTDETGYEVERSTDGTSFSRIATVGTNVVTYQNTGLTASTTYHYRVRGLKGSAGSAYTHIVNARTQGGTTSPPTAPMIDGSLSQNWTRNADRVTEITASWQDRSNNETGFDIQWGENDQYTGGLASVDANMTQHKIEGSWPGCGHKIYVRVRAKNAGGESAWSAATVTTSIAIPEPPSNVTATARSSSEAEVKWGGANESYSRESYFVIQYSNNHEPTETSGISVTVAQNSSSAVINVGPNTQYYVRVRAENCAGKSGWSTLIPVRTPAGPPATPTDLVAVATSQTVVELAWKYKTLPGFSVTFDVQRSDDGGATFNSLPVGTLAFTANASGDISGKYTNSGLTPSATYQYRVRAKTPFESAFSNLFTITMPAVPITSPAVPTNLVASATSASQINLTWNDASNNEDGFDIERSTDNVAWGNSVSVGVNTTTYAVNGLNASTKYFFRVRAKNSVGTSGWSNVADATTQAPPVTITKPTTPTSLKATASSTTQIDLSWTDASNNEEGFDIERSADNVTWGNSASAGVNAVTYAATGLNASTKYYFRVRSKNSAGASEWSNVAEATTQATSTTTLTAPSNLTVSLVNNVALLVWQDNTANETGFQVEQSVNGGNFEKLVELGANVFLYKDESLRAQSTYAYRVRAYRAMLMSDYSNTAEVRFIVTAIGPPPAESKLYPNPATNVLHYTVGSGTNPQMLRIRDTSGRLMQEIPLSGRVQEVEVPVSQLNTGTYYLEVIGNQKPQFFRFIKQ
uniref:fibronectin type III domain-containing protein n=1 Tax=Spirosoma sp. TaxID=1899569 RepID=UPI003B3A304E